MRVLLFGVDGLAFHVLDPMIEQGLLPNFKRLRDEGTQALLQSTTPPMTPPAWMSLATGLPPSEHGIYDFWDYEQTEDGPLARIVTHRKGGRAIWNVLSDWGKRVIVANVPLTYPPEPVNGIMLSGYMAPDMQAPVTYPVSFKNELLRYVPDYQIDLDPAVSGGQIGDPLAETLKMTRARLAMFRLMLDKPWDFCFLACSGADRIQHLCWDEIMAQHPQAVAYYQLLDEAIGMMLDLLGPDDLLMLVSDHGFRGVRRKFYIQQYLCQRGLLKVRASKKRRGKLFGLTRTLVRFTGLRWLARGLRRQLRYIGLLPVDRAAHLPQLPDLDWRNTRAWIPSASGFLAGYADIVFADTVTEEEIRALMADLRELRDPENGQALIVEMHREDVYGRGPFAPTQRHLIVLANEQTTLPTELWRGELWETSDVTSGIHHPAGVLSLYGEKVRRGLQIPPAHVYDIVPTILSYMNIPHPLGLTGNIVQDAFILPLTSPLYTDSNGIVKRKLKNLIANVE